MMTMSPSKMQAALSPNQKLVAVLPPSSSSSSQTPSQQQQQRWTLPLYSVASRSLQATLTWNNPTSSSMDPPDATNNSSTWQRLIFLNDDHVAGLYQHRHIVVWNIPRGIVSYTVDILKGKSTTSEDDDGSNQMIVLDVVTPLVDDSAAAATTAPFVFYALIQKDSKLYVHEYQVETGRLQRKIKCGHADQPSHNSNHSHHHSLIVVVSSLSSHSDDNDDGDDDDTPRGRILLTTGRRQVKVIDLSNGEKLSKMKLAADTSGSLIATTSNSATSNKSNVVVMAIPTASGVVVTTLDMKKDNDDKKKKKKKAELEQVAILPIMLEDSNDENHHQGALQMWLKPTTTTTTTTSSNNPSANFDLMLLLNQTDVYEYSSSNKTITVLQPKCRLERDLSTKQDDQQHVILPMSSSSSSAVTMWHQVLAVLYRRGQGILVKPIPLLLQNDDQDASTYREKITISWKDDTAEDTSSMNVDMLETSAGKKRKQPQNVATTLGPGQAGHELATVSDRPAKKQTKKQDDDDAEAGEGEAGAAAGTASSALTIAERLQQLAALAQEEDDEDDDNDDNDTNKDANNESKQQQQTKFVPKQATTQSLTQLLQQACASNDDGLLELALSVRDVRVIEQSMLELAQKQQQQQEAAVEGNAPSIKWMDVLLTRLITRLANKPQRAEALSMWIQCWLQQHQQFEASSSASSSSWQSVQGLLQPLRNLLHERVQTFSLWLQLEGRLSMMKS